MKTPLLSRIRMYRTDHQTPVDSYGSIVHSEIHATSQPQRVRPHYRHLIFFSSILTSLNLITNTSSTCHPTASHPTSTELTPPQRRSSCSRNLKPVSTHTIPIFLDHPLTVLLRIIRLTEQHTFVALGFLVFADTARFDFFFDLGRY